MIRSFVKLILAIFDGILRDTARLPALRRWLLEDDEKRAKNRLFEAIHNDAQAGGGTQALKRELDQIRVENATLLNQGQAALARAELFKKQGKLDEANLLEAEADAIAQQSADFENEITQLEQTVEAAKKGDKASQLRIKKLDLNLRKMKREHRSWLDRARRVDILAATNKARAQDLGVAGRDDETFFEGIKESIQIREDEQLRMAETLAEVASQRGQAEQVELTGRASQIRAEMARAAGVQVAVPATVTTIEAKPKEAEAEK